MIKNKMTLALVALIGSTLLFIVATFAWLTVSNIVNIGDTEIELEDIEATVTLNVSTDGGTIYNPTTAVTFANAVPGDVFYYSLVIENTGAVIINSRVLFQGFITSFAIGTGTPEKSLIDVLILDVHNTANGDIIDNQTMTSQIGELPGGLTYPNASLTLASNLDIAIGATETVFFTITVATTAGNDYGNLKLTVDAIQIQSLRE
jgi:hypothetical protein